MKRIGLILVTLVGIVVFALLSNRTARIPPTRAAKTNVDRPTASPDFTLKDLEDRDVSLRQFNGKVVLVNFWATWCLPCSLEIPWLIELQDSPIRRNQYGSREPDKSTEFLGGCVVADQNGVVHGSALFTEAQTVGSGRKG
jgi:cytochrome oxidase Cu insertion factor (SCO1/SenC/PrrC family)